MSTSDPHSSPPKPDIEADTIVTHVAITTDIAIWDEIAAAGSRAVPAPEKKESHGEPKPGTQPEKAHEVKA